MPIIDVHAHIFPERIAQKATDSIGQFYGAPMAGDGQLDTLLRYDGIARFVVHSVATTPEQVGSINRFVADSVSAHPDRLAGFMTLHPGLKDIAGEMERAAELGLIGVKLHPDFQLFALDSPEAYRIYEVIEGRFPLLIHTGDSRYHFSNPKRVPPVMRDFPELKMICAHFGGYSEWDEAERHLVGLENVWVDTASSLFVLGDERAKALIERFGTDRVMFGSDFPMWSPEQEAQRIAGLGLDEAALQRVLWDNTADLLGL